MDYLFESLFSKPHMPTSDSAFLSIEKLVNIPIVTIYTKCPYYPNILPVQRAYHGMPDGLLDMPARFWSALVKESIEIASKSL